MKIPVVVLCGGKGTRIAHLLPPDTPKCLAEVGGKPFLYHLLDQLAPCCNPVVLATGYGADLVQHAMMRRDHSQRSFWVAFSEDKPGVSTTGGALHAALSFVSPTCKHVLICNGDTILTHPERLGEFLDWATTNDVPSVEMRCAPMGNGPYLGNRSGFRVFQRQGLESKIAVDQSLEHQLIGLDVIVAGWFLDIGTSEGLELASRYFEPEIAK